MEKIMQKCVLFRGLKENELAYAVDFFHGRKKHFARGETLHTPGNRMKQFGLVLSGNIQVSMDDFDGNHMIMASVTPGITFGESLCYLGTKANVSVHSVEESDVLMMDTEALKDSSGIRNEQDMELCRRFTAMLAQRALAMNDRIQILSKTTIREKVITLLSQYTGRSGSPLIVLPFSREAMATYLGVNQSALSRELSAMQKEGIIRFHGNEFTIVTSSGPDPADM
ncbi:MAG: Crp/Fnr family transcriptional regulator [Solobacterium sp.]|nr:Crp/Fnr family transcriptional regulator [Solobacterium sp.]